MFRVVVSVFLLLFGGCSLESLSALNEVDRVELVHRNASMKLYRAYFVRTKLNSVRGHRKYLFFYNSRREELAILLHPGRRYKLYSITRPHRVIVTAGADKRRGYRHIVGILSRKGYHRVSLSKVGFTSRTALRKYKGFKTLMVEVRDYRRLLHRYRKAIRSYDASLLAREKGKLPPALIMPYLHRYEKMAGTPERRAEIALIGSRLKAGGARVETAALPSPETERVEKRTDAIYRHYRDDASYEELESYLSGEESKYALSYKERKVLQARRKSLRGEWLLKHGSLEELISAYKSNGDPRYKARIMILMKRAQERERSPG